jgi:hypothetical protein
MALIINNHQVKFSLGGAILPTTPITFQDPCYIKIGHSLTANAGMNVDVTYAGGQINSIGAAMGISVVYDGAKSGEIDVFTKLCDWSASFEFSSYAYLAGTFDRGPNNNGALALHYLHAAFGLGISFSLDVDPVIGSNFSLSGGANMGVDFTLNNGGWTASATGSAYISVLGHDLNFDFAVSKSGS